MYHAVQLTIHDAVYITCSRLDVYGMAILNSSFSCLYVIFMPW